MSTKREISGGVMNAGDYSLACPVGRLGQSGMFNGMGKDDEVGNSLNYKYRMHDPRLGRFFAVDPLAAKYPFYSQYAFSGNRVIDMVELEGLEPTMKVKDDMTGKFMPDMARIQKVYPRSCCMDPLERQYLIKLAYEQIASNPQYYHPDRFLTPYQREQKADRALAAAKRAWENKLQEIEKEKKWAYVDIAVGSAGLALNGLLYVLGTETGGATTVVAALSTGFYLDKISGGYNALNAINNGTFDANKEYSIVKGYIVDNFGENGGIIYDFASIAVDGIGAFKSILKISGADLNGMLKAFEVGLDSYSIGETVIKFKKDKL